MSRPLASSTWTPRRRTPVVLRLFSEKQLQPARARPASPQRGLLWNITDRTAKEVEEHKVWKKTECV